MGLTPDQQRIVDSFDPDELAAAAASHVAEDGMTVEDAITAALVEKIDQRIEILQRVAVLASRYWLPREQRIGERVYPSPDLYAVLLDAPLESVGVAE